MTVKAPPKVSAPVLSSTNLSVPALCNCTILPVPVLLIKMLLLAVALVCAVAGSKKT